MKQVVRIEMDGNTLKAIIHLLNAVDDENSRSRFSLSPGAEVQKAFGIDIAKVITMQTEEGNQEESSNSGSNSCR